jgi:hypothetical protein
MISEKRKRAGLKDIWNAFMVERADFSANGIPFCPTHMDNRFPTKIVTFSEAEAIHRRVIRKNPHYRFDAYVCFYEDDYKFDGKRSSIWLYPSRAYCLLKHFEGIITPDFSTYQDFPEPLKLFNTYRMRAFGYWYGEICHRKVINNVRWGTEETWRYCFDGIEAHSVVAIGTVGGSPKKLIDRKRFEKGLDEMVGRLLPNAIIVYGSANYPCFSEIRKKGVKILSYPSATASYFERRKAR